MVCYYCMCIINLYFEALYQILGCFFTTWVPLFTAKVCSGCGLAPVSNATPGTSRQPSKVLRYILPLSHTHSTGSLINYCSSKINIRDLDYT